jgi:glucose dehydrogenase
MLTDASTRPYKTVTEQMYNNPPASEWLQYRRTNDGAGYSPLKQITPMNAKNLQPIWSYSTGLTKGHEVVPVYHDGILYVTASYNVIFALDARSGKLIWRYDRDIPDKALSVVCCDVVNKGGVLYGDNFIFGTIDAHLVALNAKTGAVAWDTKVTDYAEGTTITNAPVAIHDKIVNAKPADLVDACFTNNGTVKIAELQLFQGATVCNQLYPSHSSPRMVAGEPVANDVLKCQLKPINTGDYAVAFSPTELTQLAVIFPQGVCDFSKPGVGQVPLNNSWEFF